MQEQSNFRPYAATANVMAVLARARSRNLPEVVNNDFLRITGIPEAVSGRVMQAIRFLDLIGEDGRPSDRLRSLATATEVDFRTQLAEALQEAYADDFSAVDPARDSQAVIQDAFRRYEPRSQTSRMVMLFLGLCREAGIEVLEAPRERRMQSRGRERAGAIATRSGRQAGQVKSGGGVAVDRNLLFGVTDEDIAALDESEFNEVWAALGKVARARARQRVAPPNESSEEQSNLE